MFQNLPCGGLFMSVVAAPPGSSITSSLSPTASDVSTSSSSSSATEPVASSMSPENIFKCNHCYLIFKNGKGLKTHTGRTQKQKKQPHDKEEDKSVDKSLVTQEVKEETYSPPLANSTIVSGQISICRTRGNCGGCQTVFDNEGNLINHELNVHPIMYYLCLILFKGKD